MSPALVSTKLDPDFAAAARAAVADIVGNKLRRMIDHPSYAVSVLSRFGLDMLSPSAVAARAEAMLEQELSRPHRGVFEFGRVRDLRVIVEYARHLQNAEVIHG